MKSTTYTGIDYGVGRSNIDNTTGIRFSVISQNSIDQEAFNDVWTQARDLSYEQAVDSTKTEFGVVGYFEKSHAFTLVWHSFSFHPKK